MNEPEAIGGEDPWDWAEFRIAVVIPKCFDGSWGCEIMDSERPRSVESAIDFERGSGQLFPQMAEGAIA
jgi:hypothetical protein